MRNLSDFHLVDKSAIESTLRSMKLQVSNRTLPNYALILLHPQSGSLDTSEPRGLPIRQTAEVGLARFSAFDSDDREFQKLAVQTTSGPAPMGCNSLSCKTVAASRHCSRVAEHAPLSSFLKLEWRSNAALSSGATLNGVNASPN